MSFYVKQYSLTLLLLNVEDLNYSIIFNILLWRTNALLHALLQLIHQESLKNKIKGTYTLIRICNNFLELYDCLTRFASTIFKIIFPDFTQNSDTWTVIVKRVPFTPPSSAGNPTQGLVHARQVLCQ